ncbi:MAG TPA: class I SAM-dependent rRNA methyltransferase [Kiritimatiellia bacterium]|nr:class I SAM-dependent rRNA methyltransferase [Kiritimatiellia bacterium]HRZ11099.1 class I SAM-dependent rRNA methyltransferase [Kiritimatiellia bacterium]HSA19529.1 class I SAM-dependent rRNA methyltransferase [Kiritimatiellia bacterium]
MGEERVMVRLKPGREKPVRRGHPWVFSGAVDSIEGAGAPGSVADVVAHDGTWLARGLLNPGAALQLRIYTRDTAQALDASFFQARLDAALAMRERLFQFAGGRTNAWRLVFSEADGLSGLIVDRYADVLSVQVGAAALVPHLQAIVDHLAARTGLAMHLRIEPDAATREAVDVSGVATPGPSAPGRVIIRENGLSFAVDVAGGQKTGFFLDQRENRLRVAAYARGRRVLSAYCYTGAFEVYAAAAGAVSIVGLDRSEPALELAREQHRLNATTIPVEYRAADVPEALRRYRDAGERFDLIILDPPRFVASQAQLEKGLRAYKDINLLALKLLTPGGILATFSCSGLVSAEAFRTMLGWAETDAGRRLRIGERLTQPADHPGLTSFVEGDYLKGLIGYVE